MLLNTNLSVTVFNVVKYILVFFVFDVIAHRTLESITCFFRKISLRHGHPIPLHAPRFAKFRMPLLSVLRCSTAGMFIVMLSLCTYSVELLMEFSSGSIVENVAVPDRVNLTKADRAICSVKDINYRTTADYMTQLADKCIDVNEGDGTYTLYKAVWNTTAVAEVVPICIRTTSNVLAKGSLIYARHVSKKNMSELIHELRANSLGADGNIKQSVIALGITREDIIFNQSYTHQDFTHVTGVFSALVPNTTFTCFGNVYGRAGGGLFMVQMRFCLHGSPYTRADLTFIHMVGSGAIMEDIADLLSKRWEVTIASDHDKVIESFATGVVGSALGSPFAYASFLGSTFNRDTVSREKYAALYRHCEKMHVPDGKGKARIEVFKDARAKSEVHVTIEVWALVLFICWPLLLGLLSTALGMVGKARRVPRDVMGEYAVAGRWLQERRRTEADINCDELSAAGVSRWLRCLREWHRAVYLSVKVGEYEDSLTVTANALTVQRELSKQFEEIG